MLLFFLLLCSPSNWNAMKVFSIYCLPLSSLIKCYTLLSISNIQISFCSSPCFVIFLLFNTQQGLCCRLCFLKFFFILHSPMFLSMLFMTDYVFVMLCIFHAIANVTIFYKISLHGYSSCCMILILMCCPYWMVCASPPLRLVIYTL